MQPKARMTFRFDPPKPVSRAKLSGAQSVPSSQQTEMEQISSERAEAESAKPTILGEQMTREADVPIQPAYYTGGPLQDDLYTLEELIRRSEAIRYPETVPESPNPIRFPARGRDFDEAANPTEDGPERQTHEDSALESGWLAGAFVRKESPSWWRVFASVAGAIATGALFGYLVLTLFTGDSPFPGRPVTGTDSPAQAPTDSAQGSLPSGGTGGSVSGDGTEIPANTFYLLQYGVFRSEESMNAAIEQLKGKGFSYAGDRIDGFRVFAGAAGTKEEAQLLAGQMPGLEVYVKSVVGEAFRTNGAEVQGSALPAFLKQSEELTAKLSGLAVAALQDEIPKPMDGATLSPLRESHRLWTKSAKEVAGLTGTAKSAALSMEQALNAAMISVDDYGRKLSRFHLWSIQSEVINAILADRQLRTALRTQK